MILTLSDVCFLMKMGALTRNESRRMSAIFVKTIILAISRMLMSSARAGLRGIESVIDST